MDGFNAIGSGYRDQDLLNYPHLYMYDKGFISDEPKKGCGVNWITGWKIG
jgi:hypothetical protein